MTLQRTLKVGSLALCTVLFSSAAALAQIRVLLNGQPITFPDQQPAMVQNRILVPLRGVLEALGAHIQWDPTRQAVTAVRGSTTVQLAVGSRDASVNNNPTTLDVPAQLIGGRTMVPLRFVSEALGARVGWDDTSQTVTINTGDGTAAGQGGGNPGNNLGQSGGNANGLLPVTNDVVVTSFTVQNPGPYHPGDAVQVEMRGTPGAKGFFTVGGNGSAMEMQETQPGVYTGIYHVPVGAHGSDVSIVGRLEKNGASSPLTQVATPITIAALAPAISQLQPARGSVVSNQRPTIYALFTPGSGVIDPQRVHLTVNGEDVTAQATVTPAFITYTPTADLPAGPVQVDVIVEDDSGLRTQRQWAFNVQPREGIRSLVQSAKAPLGPGDVLNVTLTGAPGGLAWFTVPGVADRIQMQETAPGTYTGSYTVKRGDQLVGQAIVGHLNAGGANFSEKATAPLVIWTRDANRPVITSPAEGSRVSNNLMVTGTADPLSTVKVTVSFQQTVLGIFGANGNVDTETVTADANGHWQTNRIPLTGVFGTSGVRYTISAVETNPANQQSAAAVVHANS